jgi:hypothetical protein
MSAAQSGSAVETDDFVFIFVSASGSVASSNTPAPPTGFAELVQWQAMGTSTTSSWGLYVKRRAPGDTNYDIPQINVGRTNIVTAHAWWVDGTDAADVVEWTIGTLKTRAASGGTFSTDAPSVTTPETDAMVFAFGAERTAAAETESQLTVSGTGWTKQLALLGVSAANSTITVASKGMAVAGATGDCTFTSVNTQASNGHALQVIIPAADGIITPPSTVAGTLYDGTQVVTGSWYVMEQPGDVIAPLDFAGMIHPGSPSIDAMLDKPVFYCGHRGGSANYPEMSMHAYTQAALRGYDALEISLARSSDGVWFGLHDASLDRTSLGTGGGSGTTLVASTMTWAEIQAYDIRPATVAPVDALHKPYMELEDLLDAYGKTHVLFIDPKSAAGNSTYRAELIAILQNRSYWQERMVAKTVPGNSTNAWATAARAAGFQVNAMFYPADNFVTYHAQADILGMDHGASSGVWTSIVALGKPVMVHVCQNTTQVAAGTANGAVGAMVSGIVQVPRVPGL